VGAVPIAQTQTYPTNEQTARSYITELFASNYGQAWELASIALMNNNPMFQSKRFFIQWYKDYDAGLINGVITHKKEILLIETTSKGSRVGMRYRYQVRQSPVKTGATTDCISEHAILFEFDGDEMVWMKTVGSAVVECVQVKIL